MQHTDQSHVDTLEIDHGAIAAPRASGGFSGPLAGLLYGVPAGLLLTGLSTDWDKIPVIFGVIGGAVIGMILGRLFGRFQRVASGVAFGAVAPLILILIDGVRSGRLTSGHVDVGEALLPLLWIVGGGALVGGLMTATAKGLRSLRSAT